MRTEERTRIKYFSSTYCQRIVNKYKQTTYIHTLLVTYSLTKYPDSSYTHAIESSVLIVFAGYDTELEDITIIYISALGLIGT